MANPRELFASWNLELNYQSLNVHFPAEIICFPKFGEICRHPKNLSFEEFLDGALALERFCTFAQAEPKALQDLCRRIDKSLLPLSPDKLMDGYFLEMSVPRCINEFFHFDSTDDSIFSTHDRILRAEIRDDLARAEALLLKFLKVEDISILENLKPEDFSYVNSRLGDFTPPLQLLTQELYGNFGSEVLRVPSKLIKSIGIEEYCVNYGVGALWEDDLLAIPGAEVSVLGPQDLNEVLLAKTDDDDSVFEAFRVFMRSMDLEDALNAARVI